MNSALPDDLLDLARDVDKVHPRGQATFSRVLGHYVREEKALDLMTALKKMTMMPAQRLEKRAPIFKDKGRIRLGADADITVFDSNHIIDKATYEDPLQYSEGIQFVLVNGVTVVKDGQLVDNVFPGRAARTRDRVSPTGDAPGACCIANGVSACAATAVVPGSSGCAG